MQNYPILLVEDEDTDVMLLQQVFKLEGIPNALLAVEDGRQAIEYLTGHGEFADRRCYPVPRLILLDLNLPHKTGFEVLRWLRSQPSLKRMPVIIFTSSPHSADRNIAYDLGANAYVVKPSNLTQLGELVKSLRDFWLVHNQPPNDS
jgi:CheY-like chemotaxis protein